jgi:holo-[acyl-carrier protein] synthase
VSVAIGIDLQPFSEIEDSIKTFGPRYMSRLYTATELRGLSREPHLAARVLASLFAAKEAVIKVLAPVDDMPSWHEIEIQRIGANSASVSLSGVAAQLAQRHGLSDIIVHVGVAGECAAALALAHTSIGEAMQTR